MRNVFQFAMAKHVALSARSIIGLNRTDVVQEAAGKDELQAAPCQHACDGSSGGDDDVVVVDDRVVLWQS